jgi:type II secretory pathway pseudopilin PulG
MFMAIRHRCGSSSGFSLIETALSLLIIGLLVTPLFVLYNNYIVEKKTEETYLNVQDVIERLDDFRVVNGFYPCPAPMKVAPDSELYGVDSCATANESAGFDEPMASLIETGTCDTELGLCVEESIRGGLANPRVIVGHIPFRALQIDERDAYDAYGSRLVYAVTESMSNLTTIDDAAGAISVKDLTDSDLSDVAGSFGIIAFSHGIDQIGAYTKDGTLARRCVGDNLDIENCNPGFESGDAGTAEYITAFKEDGFDDVMVYFTDSRPPLWQRINDEVESIRDLSPDGVAIGKAIADNVTLDIAAPTIGGQDSLHIRGAFSGANPEGTQGAIIQPLGAELCNDDGEHCMDIQTLFGTEEFNCPPGQYARGISNGELLCTDDVQIACDPESDFPILNGVTPTGEPICVEIPQDDCPARTERTAQTCWNNLNLPAANHGTVILVDETEGFIDANGTPAVEIVGNCTVVEYTCNDGSWQMTGHPGSEGRCNVLFPSTPLPPNYCDEDDPDLECEPCAVPGECGSFCVSQRYVCDVHDEYEPFAPDPDAYWAISIDYGNPTVTEDCTCADRPDEEARMSCREHFVNPNYGAAEIGPNWPIAGVPPLNYGTAGPAIATTTYSSAEWPACTGTTGPYNTSLCSCVNPSAEQSNETADPIVLDGNPLTNRWRELCPVNKIVDPANTHVPPIPSVAPHKGIVKQKDWQSAVSQCEWSGVTTTTDYCICDVTPVLGNRPHTCGDPVCEIPNPLFPDWFMRIPASTGACVLGPEIPLTPSTDPAKPLGECMPRPFQWVRVGTTGEQAEIVPPSAIIIGSACSCNDHMDTQGPEDYVICYPASSNDIDFCRCQSSY